MYILKQLTEQKDFELEQILRKINVYNNYERITAGKFFILFSNALKLLNYYIKKNNKQFVIKQLCRIFYLQCCCFIRNDIVVENKISYSIMQKENDLMFVMICKKNKRKGS